MMRLRSALVLLSICCGPVAFAAPARDGFVPDLVAARSAPRFAGTDSAALAAAQKTVAENTHNQPLPFAVGAEMPLELADGSWSTAADGSAVWRMRLASSGAKLIAVGFQQLKLPSTARLYLYDSAGDTVQGPYVASDLADDGSLITAVVPGAEAAVELRVDATQRDQVSLKLARIYHGFRALSGNTAVAPSDVAAKSLTGDTAAACEVNVACPAGDAWRDPIRAVALLQVGSGVNLYLCSGQMVDTLRGDNSPYFLTAHHCNVGGSLTTPASSVVLYFNYQASSCNGTTGSLNQTMNGSTVLATDAGSDFTLLQLRSQPPSAYNVYYAGWDSSTSDIPTSGVAMHHPVADIKKISTFAQPVSRTQIQLNTGAITNQTVQAWQVSWTSGITEDGSSGSGLWNQDHRVVGVLSGGNTACASGTASTGQDFFGRLDVAWTANTSSSGQLQAWLDPDNTGVRCANGRNPGDPAASSSCSASNGGSSSSKSGGAIAPLNSLGLIALWLVRRRRQGSTG